MAERNASQPTRARGLARVALRLAWLLSAPLHATTLTVQIDGVEDNLQAAVTASAEIAQYSGRDISAAQVRRLYANAPEQVAKSLEAYGFYNATADGELKETPKGFTAILHVKPGEPTTVAELAIDLPEPASEEKNVAKALASFAPAKGQRFDHGEYERSKA